MRLLWLLPCLLWLSACDKTPEPAPDTQAVAEASPWLNAERALMDALQTESDTRLRRLTVSATGFADAIDGLLNDTSAERLGTARQAWSHLYQSFNQAFVVLLCRGTQSPVDLVRLQRTDSFPILPGYIDGLNEWPDSGIVNDVSLALTRDTLLEQQDATLEGEASIGFQVIHFLLHGEPAHPRTVEALQMVTELDEDMLGELADQPTNRRRAYLQLVTDLLVEDLTLMARQENTALEISPECPVGAARETVARLIQLEGLRDHTSVSQDFMAASVREAASTGLQQGLTPWLAADGTLAGWLPQRLDNAGDLPAALPGMNDADRVARLQAIHAALAGTEAALRRAGVGQPQP